MNKELFYYFLQNRVFIDNLTNDEIEEIYKYFKKINKDRCINSFLGTLDYLFRR